MNGWVQRGEWLYASGDRFRVARMDLFHGRSYSLYDWYPPDDWAPKLLKVGNSLEAVIDG